jgi:hypothetical protein
MKIIGDCVRLSATDLANHVACRHLTSLDLAVAQERVAPPEKTAWLPASMQRRGEAHERAFVVLKILAARLDAAGMIYMVTGSIAAGYYSEPRMTRDIDLVVELDAPDADRIAALLTPEFLLERETIVNATRQRRIFNVIHVEAAVKADIIVRKDTPYRREKLGRRRQVTIDGQLVWVVSAEDLILSKLEWSKDSGSELQT